MRTLQLLIQLAIIGILPLSGQAQQYGIYKSAKDFSQKNLASGFNAHGEKVCSDDGREISMATGGTVYHHGSIWGFRYNNIDWREFEGSTSCSPNYSKG